MHRQDESTFQREFSSIFRPMLHAVEARRRRHRIEKALGYLPEMPKSMPEPKIPDERRMITGESPTLDSIQKQRQAVEEARKRLADLRRLPGEGDTAKILPLSAKPGAVTKADAEPPAPGPDQVAQVEAAPPSAEPSEPTTPADAARAYHRLAQEWYESTQDYRGADAEEDEAIRQVAASTLAEAAAEVRREAIPREKCEELAPPERRAADSGALPTVHVASLSDVPREATVPETLQELFWQVLAWEREAKKWLEKVGAAEEERSRLEEKTGKLSRLQQEQGGD